MVSDYWPWMGIIITAQLISYNIVGLCGTSYGYVGHFWTMWDTMGDIWYYV